MNISAAGMQPMQQGPGPVGKAMTDEQKTTATAILEKYDSSSMDEASTEAMRAELKEANIAPSKELGGMLEAGGFAMDGPQGGGKPQGPPPGGGKQMSGIESVDETSDIYEELMEALEEGDDETVIELAKQMTDSVDPSGLFIDEQA